MSLTACRPSRAALSEPTAATERLGESVPRLGQVEHQAQVVDASKPSGR